jgi:hypothetical protein
VSEEDFPVAIVYSKTFDLLDFSLTISLNETNLSDQFPFYKYIKRMQEQSLRFSVDSTISQNETQPSSFVIVTAGSMSVCHFAKVAILQKTTFERSIKIDFDDERKKIFQFRS